MDKLKQYFSDWTKLDFIWLLIANTIILSLGLYWGDGPIALIFAMSGITCVIFVSKQMTANYYFGVINVYLYACLALQAKLYGNVMLNLGFYLPSQFLGLYLWNKNKRNNKSNKVEAKRLTNKQRLLVAISSFIAIILYSFVLQSLGGNIPFIDATSTVLSIIAQILMLFLFVEQWYLWVLVNIVSIIMWVVSLTQGVGDISTLIMWILYLANSLYGLYNWRKANQERSN